MENMKNPMQLIKEWAVQEISEMAGRGGSGCQWIFGEIKIPDELLAIRVVLKE